MNALPDLTMAETLPTPPASHKAIRGACLAPLLSVLLTSGPVGAGLPRDSGNWFEARSDHFVVASNLGKRRVEAIVSELEVFRTVLGKILPRVRHTSLRPVYVFVFANEKQFREYAFHRWNADGVFVARPSRSYMLVNGSSDSPMETVFHEYVHQVVDDNFVALPLWLSEGIALYYETFAITGDTVEVGRNPLRYTRWLRARSWAPLRPILRATRESDAYRGHQATYFYVQSWLTVNYLLTQQGQQWRNSKKTFSLVADGTPSDQAIETAFGVPLEQFEKRLQIYGQGPIYNFHQFEIGDLQTKTSPEVRTLGYGEVLERLGRLLALGYKEDGDQAAEFLSKAAELLPGDVDVAMAQGVLALERDRFREAEERFAFAASTDPTLDEVHYFLGATLLKEYADETDRLMPAGDETPEALLKARRSLERAVELNPSFVKAHVGLGRTYVLGGAQPPEVVIKQCANVLDRIPDLELAVTQMLLHAKTGDIDSAREIYDARISRIRGALGGHSTEDTTSTWKWVQGMRAWAQLFAARAMAERGRVEEAVALLEEGRDGAPEHLIEWVEEALTRQQESGRQSPDSQDPDE